MNDKKTKNKGFASPNMDPAVAFRIHSAGGKASHGGGRPRKVKPPVQQELLP